MRFHIEPQQLANRVCEVVFFFLYGLVRRIDALLFWAQVLSFRGPISLALRSDAPAFQCI